MMLIDVTRLLERTLFKRIPTGVDRVGLYYMEHFQKNAHAVVNCGGRWVVLNDAASRRAFDSILKGDRKPLWKTLLYIGFGYIFGTRNNGCGALLLNAVHTGTENPSYAREIEKRGLRPLFFLHDLIPITHPAYCRAGEDKKHRQRIKTILTTGRAVIVNSADTRQVLESYAGKNGMPLPPCHVAPLAPGQLPKPANVRPLNAPYFVVLGTIEARKNHIMLLELWWEMIAELGDKTPRLVVIGKRGWECAAALDMLDNCAALKGFVIEKSFCKDAELATWLGHARALLFPSFTEGFGIPLVEALMLKVPAIVSDLAVFHEIAGGIPSYADPRDATAWKNLVLDYAGEDSKTRAAQLARMQDYAVPTWDAHFADVDKFLKTLGIVA